ncbi:MAG: S8 family serine peptidase, partial [Planctomycetota bacterium]
AEPYRRADDLDADPGVIEVCEQRHALSASLVGDFLADWVDPLSPHVEPMGPLPAGVPDGQPLPIAETLPTYGLERSNSGSPVSPLDISLLNPAAEWRNGLLGGAPIDGSGQTVAIIDSGIAYDHVALGGGYGAGHRVVGGWDFAENDADPYDDGPEGYHGSHVAGLVGGSGSTPSGNAFAGVATGVDFVGLRVFDDFGNGNLDWIESALQWVHDNQDTFESPITTVNLSLGTELNDGNRDSAMSLLEDELQLLYEDDILVFASTGNSFDLTDHHDPSIDPVLYPASSEWVVGVGSVTEDGDLSSFSQREDGIYGVPGQALRSTVPDHLFGADGYHNDYAIMTGTSMASPQLAGASTLIRQALLEAGLEAGSDQILQHMESASSEHVDSVTGITYRTLDLDAALHTILGQSEEVPAGSDASDHNLIDQFVGSDGTDEIELDLASYVPGEHPELQIQSGGDVYRWRLSGSGTQDAPYVLDGGSGGDELRLVGTEGAERLLLGSIHGDTPSRLTFSGGVIELRGFESVTFVGGGGVDRATLYDSPHDDTLLSNATGATLSGVGFEYVIEDVANIYVHAKTGGNDVSHLTDTAGDDALAVRPQFSSLRSDGLFRGVYGFEEVYAYADQGGHDTADLGDSERDDVMNISRSRSMITSEGYRATAFGFEDVVAMASRGGDDLVRIYVDDPGGTWHTADSMTQWIGSDGTARLARGFERAEAFERFDSHPQSLFGPTPAADDLVAGPPTEESIAADVLALQEFYEELGREPS